MSPAADYYNHMRKLAGEQRATFQLTTAKIGRREFRAIYTHYGIEINLWPMPGLSGETLNHLRGAYMNIDGELHVLADRTLPNDPYLFTLAHELKHHLCDSGESAAFCHDENQKNLLEIGAEVFAAELLYPQQEFIQGLTAMGITQGTCTQEDLVRLKHASGTSLSYTGLRKRAIGLGYASNSIGTKGWKQIEHRIYGVPVYLRKR